MKSKQVSIMAAMLVTVSAAFTMVSIAPKAPASSASVQAKAFQHAPMKRVGVAPLVENGAAESYNWSGFAVTGTAFTDAKGSWVVPAVDCTKSPNAWASFWVGIDGANSSTVEQTGTGVWCNRRVAEYYAWYEFYPAGTSVISGITVTPGDIISAEVKYASSEFTVTITDTTAGTTFTTTQAVSGAERTSAEWIAEAPSAATGILNLADFSVADFGKEYTSIAGTNAATDAAFSGVISKFGTKVERITQVDDTVYDEAIPSTLSTDGSSFSSKWIEYN
jgi:Peptidase A4 family